MAVSIAGSLALLFNVGDVQKCDFRGEVTNPGLESVCLAWLNLRRSTIPLISALARRNFAGYVPLLGGTGWWETQSEICRLVVPHFLTPPFPVRSAEHPELFVAPLVAVVLCTCVLDHHWLLP